MATTCASALFARMQRGGALVSFQVIFLPLFVWSIITRRGVSKHNHAVTSKLMRGRLFFFAVAKKAARCGLDRNQFRKRRSGDRRGPDRFRKTRLVCPPFGVSSSRSSHVQQFNPQLSRNGRREWSIFLLFSLPPGPSFQIDRIVPTWPIQSIPSQI